MKEHKFIKKVAEMYVTRNVNSACITFFHQPKIPVSCNKFKKQK